VSLLTAKNTLTLCPKEVASNVLPVTGLEEQVEYNSASVHLLVRAFAGIVLMLIVRIDLNAFTESEKATCTECRRAPFLELAFAEELGAGIGCRVIGTNRESGFDPSPHSDTAR
jgi:hypothetical protein